jgi:Ribbon-helix-helix protein, copG family
MKRLQIMIDEELDDALGRLAVAEGVSKAALVRRFVGDAIRPLPPLASDPLMQISGTSDFEPGDVDEVVYG